MEKLLQQLVTQMAEIKGELQHMTARLDGLEAKFNQLDSIEHRVTVNQIDIADIKETVEKLDELQVSELQELAQRLKEQMGGALVKEELKHLHQRLDAQLLKIARNEEALLMMGGKELQ